MVALLFRTPRKTALPSNANLKRKGDQPVPTRLSLN